MPHTKTHTTSQKEGDHERQTVKTVAAKSNRRRTRGRKAKEGKQEGNLGLLIFLALDTRSREGWREIR